MNSLTIYLAIGSILIGLAWADVSKDCGKMQKIEAIDVIAITIAWPAAVVASLTHGPELISEYTCDD